MTTALELEGGAFPIARWYEVRAGRARIHFGASESHGGVRARVIGDTLRQRRGARRHPHDAGVPDCIAYRKGTLEQIREMEALVDQELTA